MFGLFLEKMSLVLSLSGCLIGLDIQKRGTQIMTIVTFDQPAFTRRNPDMICWRVSAIYRCCLRLGMSKEWAVSKLREISPEGHRDHMADLWFANIESVRRHYFAEKSKEDDLAGDPEELSLAA
jgi:hypothetical protein